MLNERLYFELGLFLKLQEKHSELTDLKIVSNDPLSVAITLNIHQIDYLFDVMFLEYYPFQPIIVFNKNKNMKTSHMYGDETMCLRYGNDNWHEDLTVKEIIENLIELITIENPLGERQGTPESGHLFSQYQQQGRSGGSFYLDETLLPFFQEDAGIFKLKRIRQKSLEGVNQSLTLFFLHSIKRKRTTWHIKNTEKLIDAAYVKLNITKDEFLKNISQYLNKYSQKKRNLLVFLKNSECAFIHLEPFESKDEKTGEIRQRFFVYNLQVIKIEDDKNKRLNLPAELFMKRIIIFGLGSVGSRVFLDLVRAGFKQFLLVDDDLFLPNNMIRHELTMEHIGMLKITALNKIARKINPSVQVFEFPFALNGQQSTGTTAELLNALSQADIAIDCSANSNLIFSINEVIRQHDINFIAGSVISGGLGNMLLVRPQGSKLNVVDLIESQKKFISINKLEKYFMTDYSGKFGSIEYVATMSDISIIAGKIGKYAINLLLNNPEDQLKANIYVTSTSNKFFGEAFTTYPLLANKRKYTPKKLDPKLIKRGKEFYARNYPHEN